MPPGSQNTGRDVRHVCYYWVAVALVDLAFSRSLSGASGWMPRSADVPVVRVIRWNPELVWDSRCQMKNATRRLSRMLPEDVGVNGCAVTSLSATLGEYLYC